MSWEIENLNTAMIDESSLASGIYENLRKCVALREKYMMLSLQVPGENPKDDIPDERVLTSILSHLYVLVCERIDPQV